MLLLLLLLLFLLLYYYYYYYIIISFVFSFALLFHHFKDASHLERLYGGHVSRWDGSLVASGGVCWMFRWDDCGVSK